MPDAPIESFLHSSEPWVELALRLADGAGVVHHARRREPPLLFEHLRTFDLERAPRDVVPDMVHAVFVGGALFPGFACLSPLAAALVRNPREIVVHVDVPPQRDAAWACAREFAFMRMHGPFPSAAEAVLMPRIAFAWLLPQHDVRGEPLLDQQTEQRADARRATRALRPA